MITKVKDPKKVEAGKRAYEKHKEKLLTMKKDIVTDTSPNTSNTSNTSSDTSSDTSSGSSSRSTITIATFLFAGVGLLAAYFYTRKTPPSTPAPEPVKKFKIYME